MIEIVEQIFQDPGLHPRWIGFEIWNCIWNPWLHPRWIPAARENPRWHQNRAPTQSEGELD